MQQELSSESALAMARQWEPRRNPYSEQWQELVHAARPFLMELACFPDSKLSAEVELRLGQGSSMRVSHWNGGDLETPEGVKLVQKLVREIPAGAPVGKLRVFSLLSTSEAE